MSLAQLDLHGDISGEDVAGHRIAVQFRGACVTLDLPSTGSALAALRAMRHLRANGTSAAIAPVARLGLNRVGNMEVEWRIRGLTVARAGEGATATRLGHLLTGLPIEMHLRQLLRAVFHPRVS